MNKDTDKTKEQLIAELGELRKKSKEQEDKLKASNQQLDVHNQQLEASNKELIGKDQLLSSIFNTVGDVLFLIDAEAESKFRFKYINKAFLDATGLSRSDIEGKLIEEVIPEPSIHIVKENYLKSIKEKKLITWEETSEYPAGVKTGIVSIVPVIDEKGNCRQLVGSVHDITERKQAEEKLIESEKRLHKMFNNHAAIMLLIDPESGAITDANIAAQVFYGYSHQQLCALRIHEINQLSNDEVDKEIQNAQNEQRNYFIFPHKLKNGQIRTVEVRSTPIEINNKEMLFSIIQDITERKEAEEELKENEERFRTVFNNANDIMYTVEVTKEKGPVVVDANNSAFELLGYTRDELIGMPMTELDSEESKEKIPARVKRIMSGGKCTFESVQLRKDGSAFPVEVSARLIKIAGKTYIHSVNRDITERRQAEEKLKKSEKFSKDVIDSMMDGFSILDNGGVHLDVNKSFSKMTGYNKEELIGIGPPHPYWPEEEFENIQKAFEKTTQGIFESFELVFKKKNGERFPVIVSPSQLKDDKGNVIANFASIKDITERKQAEVALASSEEKLKILFESAPDAYYIIDKKGNFIDGNKAAEKILGYNREELIGKNFAKLNLLSSKDLPTALANLAMNALGKSTGPDEFTLRRKDGVLVPLEIRTHPVKIAGKKVILGIARDVTERKQAEEEIIQQNEFLNNILESLTYPFYIIDINDYSILKANSASGLNLGLNKITCHVLTHNSDVPCNNQDHPCPLEIVKKTRKPAMVEHIHFDKAGNKKNVEVYCYPVFDKNGAISSVIEYSLDVTERKQAEEELLVLETAIDNAIECIMVSDRENRLTYVNRAFEKLTGYSAAEALGNTPGMLKSGQHDRAFYQNLKKTIYAGHPWEGNITFRKKNGDYYDVYATITPICDQAGIPEHFVSVHRDVTKEREQEKRFQQNQRLEAIGTLAGGIAHDFNNLLTPILGFTDLSIRALPPGSKTKDYLEQVLLAANRSKELVQQILSFSRRSNHERKPLLMAPIIKESLKLLRASIPSTIDIKEEIYATTEMAVADPTEIHQVMMNLCTNAYQAMPDGGVLTVTLKTVDLDSDTVAIIPNCKPGQHLKLSVEDTGQGIPPEIRDRIFEPYFTSKEEGRGTGLGLAVTHSIVAASGGGITVLSESGNGTRFNVYLPVAEGSPTDAVEKQAVIRSGHERILFVDDEPAIVELGQKMLEQYGYSVTTSVDPVQALERFKNAPADFDMVITDMTMPGMTGEQLTTALLHIRPDLPIVVCTGFSERMNKEKAQEIGIRKLLDKPIAPSALLSTIREIFDSEE